MTKSDRIHYHDYGITFNYTDSYQREKRLLLDENVQMRKQKEIIERESNRKDTQIMQANSEVDKVASTLRTAETNLQITQNQVRVHLLLNGVFGENLYKHNKCKESDIIECVLLDVRS